MSARRHWIALDDTFSRLVPASVLRHARERLGHRAAALSDIYVARMLKAIGETGTDQQTLLPYLDELQVTHRELAAALTRRDQAPRTVEAD